MDELVGSFQEFWRKGTLIKEWKKTRFYPIFKGGDANDTGNYRGVSLLDIGYKILAGVMERRLRAWVEKNKILKESQAGFRGRRGTRDHIFVLNSLIGSKLKREGGKVYAAFIHFKKAFDTVDRVILEEKLRAIGVEGRFLNRVNVIYKETWCELITSKGVSKPFKYRWE